MDREIIGYFKNWYVQSDLVSEVEHFSWPLGVGWGEGDIQDDEDLDEEDVDGCYNKGMGSNLDGLKYLEGMGKYIGIWM